jgi:DNA-binding response OmpR family regulator
MGINAANRALNAPPLNPQATTILVIDDDMGVQMFVTQVLRNQGYQVLAAADLQEALHVSDVCPTAIHLILTDIMLPTGNGIALAHALVAKRKGTPVLYMSGAGSAAIHAIQFEGAPVGDFLEKPFPPDMLVKKVRAVLLQAAAESGAEPVAVSPSASDAAAQRPSSDAVYRLESDVRCPRCRETISTLQAVRLLRTQVNFTSTLPRRGRVLVCPGCGTIVSAELTAF